MSEEKKDLGDKAEEAFDNAKEKAKEFAEEAKEKASEFAEEAKEATSDFAESAKKTANEFTESAKEAFSTSNPDSGKNIAIIAHITLIGWIIALVMNSNKTELGSFYIRQTLGIFLLGFIISWIPFVNLIGWILIFILWIMSLIGALNESKKPIFIVGEMFQNWFKSL